MRIAALTVLADSRRTSELFGPDELRLIVRFVSANLTNQTPAFRQQLLALMKKVRGCGMASVNMGAYQLFRHSKWRKQVVMTVVLV